MGRPALEVADIFREHGPAWRETQRGRLSLTQLKVMSAITHCRTATLGGHVLRCGGCGTDSVAYNSCRNRHCPKCQSTAAERWLQARQDDLLPVEYHHVVFTLPAPIADLAHQNEAVIYGILFDTAAEVLQTIAADPKHLGARIGATMVLRTWGSALTHHPHVHAVAPGGGLSPYGKGWVACRPGFFLPVRVLSRLFRRRFLEELLKAHRAGKLKFFGEHVALACLSRYTHRMAIASSRLLAMDERGITFRWKDYRVKEGAAVGASGKTRHKAMTLAPEEFMRRFLLHVLPGGFHRIRYYGLLADGIRKASLALARELLGAPRRAPLSGDDCQAGIRSPTFVRHHCGRTLPIVQTFTRGHAIRAPPRP